VAFEAGSKLSSICSETFAHCSPLLSIRIPSSVEWIADNCFFGCSALLNATLEPGSKLTSIPEGR
jgi:hypothetical protein